MQGQVNKQKTISNVGEGLEPDRANNLYNFKRVNK
jgi:hypothetical protein